jgi:Flp pilus assembly protein TadB
MNPTLVLAAVFWVGSVLLLGELRWFRRPRLVTRMAPYLPGTPAPGEASTGAAASFRQLAAPTAQQVGATLSRAFGVREELTIRLERVHSPMSVSAFRVRQLGWSSAASGVASLIVASTRPPGLLALALVFGAALLAFLVVEQRLATASTRWQRRVFLELPVVSEQLGMMLSAGYSVGAALHRLAQRGRGACAADLRRVCSRIRHGLAEHEALDEWVAVSGVPAVARLVAVLELDRESGDLGRLINEESRAVRREVHRELIEAIERRSQQVWIPVTVATLVPGVLLIAVPFLAAMQLFTAS